MLHYELHGMYFIRFIKYISNEQSASVCQNSGHCGQMDTGDKSNPREHLNPYQCVKNNGHCGQLDIEDKSITT